jgi:hypothetical protein
LAGYLKGKNDLNICKLPNPKYKTATTASFEQKQLHFNYNFPPVTFPQYLILSFMVLIVSHLHQILAANSQPIWSHKKL